MLPTPQEHIWFFAAIALPDPALPSLLPPDRTPDSATPAGLRVAALATLMRRQRRSETRLELLWLPRSLEQPAATNEALLIGTFLQAWEKFQPPLIGYNSSAFELPLLLQRALVTGLPLPPSVLSLLRSSGAADNQRPHLALGDLLTADSGAAAPPLELLAPACGIPGVVVPERPAAAQLWQESRIAEIVEECCYRALSTYLLWLRLAYTCGKLSHEACDEEQHLLFERLTELGEAPETQFLNRFVDEWERLKAATGQ